MIKLEVIAKSNEYIIKVPKQIMEEKVPGEINGKIFAYDTVDGLELKAHNDEETENFEDYKVIMKENSDVLEQLADL